MSVIYMAAEEEYKTPDRPCVKCQRGNEVKPKRAPSRPASPLLLLLCRCSSIQQKQPGAFPAVSQSCSPAAHFTILPPLSILFLPAFLSPRPGGDNACRGGKKKKKRRQGKRSQTWRRGPDAAASGDGRDGLLSGCSRSSLSSFGESERVSVCSGI